MIEFLLKLAISGALSLVIWAGATLFGFSLAWWIAAVISLVLVFGGWFIFVDSDGSWDW